MRRRSFTLVELLLVIGVIAILSCILLPAMVKVKEKVKTTVCLGNVRQLYLGAVQYANNFDGFMYANIESYAMTLKMRMIAEIRVSKMNPSYDWSLQLVWPKYFTAKNMYCPAYPETTWKTDLYYFYDFLHWIDPPVNGYVKGRGYLFPAAQYSANAAKLAPWDYIQQHSSYEWARQVYPWQPTGLWSNTKPYTEGVRIGNHPNMVFQTCFYSSSVRYSWWHEKTSSVRTKSGGCFPIAYQDGAVVIERVSPNGWHANRSVQKKATKLYLDTQGYEIHQAFNYYLLRRDNNERSWR